MTAPHTPARAPRLLTAAALTTAALATAGLFAAESSGTPRTDAPGARQPRPVTLLPDAAPASGAQGPGPSAAQPAQIRSAAMSR
ncbi:hypothetical protein NLX86_20135 [Streptomyces sp. A3M-1-3]|uniref:hypothetical protein n=1 Tax=Streptomyces sp. A3M-1-3 TaxID=2962044 RepID=UPI0020B7BDA2|nr:hypothetical protein [Streptomyces sp. A3M-1-3]MCP3820322.1 hypothetical protein [Streptomyces sp. A3M-1-3]